MRGLVVCAALGAAMVWCVPGCGGSSTSDAGADASACAPGQALCGADCVTLSSDPDHCGACNAACDQGEVCASGVCGTSCSSGEIVCGDRCVDPASDPVFCGASGACEGTEDGETCGAGEVCVSGACATSC